MRSATPTIDPVTTHKGFGACEETRAVGGSQHPAAIVVSNPAWFIAAASRLQQIRCTDDHSAITDCRKLAESGFAGRRAILIYGFDDPQRPLVWLIDAFEAIATLTVPARSTGTGIAGRPDASGVRHGLCLRLGNLDSRTDSNERTHRTNRTHDASSGSWSGSTATHGWPVLIRKRSLVQVQVAHQVSVQEWMIFA